MRRTLAERMAHRKINDEGIDKAWLIIRQIIEFETGRTYRKY